MTAPEDRKIYSYQITPRKILESGDTVAIKRMVFRGTFQYAYEENGELVARVYGAQGKRHPAIRTFPIDRLKLVEKQPKE